MSCNRENVTWVSRDGTWNRGFFEYYSINTDDPDWDYEWDVEYDHSRFDWVSVGHATEEAASASWDGANPGGSNVYATPSEATDRFDEMAATLLKECPWMRHPRRGERSLMNLLVERRFPSGW